MITADEAIAGLRAGTFFGPVAGLSNYDYHALDKYWSSTQLKYLVSTSPRHFKSKYIDKNPEMKKAQTLDQALGSAVHSMVLTPDEFGAEFIVLREDLNLRTKADREERDQMIADNPHKMLIKSDMLAEAQRMTTSVRESAQCMAPLVGAEVEVSLFWKCAYSGLSLRAKLDGYNKKTDTLIELKTAASADPDEFARQCDNLNYDLSLAHYRQGISAIWPVALTAEPRNVFLVVESDQPYVSERYFADPALVSVGHQKWLEAVDKLSDGLKTGVWRGYGFDEVTTIKPTPWSIKKYLPLGE
jgi:PDDEXK-like domain of unknown function (DUF3799)